MSKLEPTTGPAILELGKPSRWNIRLEIASRIAAGMASDPNNSHGKIAAWALGLADDLIAQELASREEKEDQS